MRMLNVVSRTKLGSRSVTLCVIEFRPFPQSGHSPVGPMNLKPAVSLPYCHQLSRIGRQKDTRNACMSTEF